MRTKSSFSYLGLLFLLVACELGGQSAQLGIGSFSVDPNVVVNEETRFRWSVSGEEPQCRLDAGDGSAEMSVDCAEGEQAHVYSEAGTYEATLTATDAQGGMARETEEVQVGSAVGLPNEAPTASFTATPGSGALEVAFDASGSSDPENDTLSYAWTFGDGETGEGAQVTHTYGAAGDYQVTLTVDDGRGENDTQTETVTVGETAPAFTELTWETVAPQPYKVAEAQGEVVNGKLYVFGGFDSTKGCCTPTARAYVYDPAQNTWTPIQDMPPMNGTGYGGVTHAGMATDGEDIYFAGGYTSDEDGDFQIFGTPETWRYDVSEDNYSRLPNLPETPESGPNNRHSAGQMEYLDGKLHYFGGTSANRKSDVPYHFVLDLAGGASEWTRAAPLPAPRNHLGSAVLNGKIYAIGGQTGHDGGLTTHDDVYVYDPAVDSWTAVQSLPQAISHISNSSFVMNGRIIVVGGEVDHLDAIRDVVAYDPAADTWTSLTELPVALQSMVSGAINGTIYVTSGSGGRGGDVSGFQDETYKGVPQN